MPPKSKKSAPAKVKKDTKKDVSKKPQKPTKTKKHVEALKQQATSVKKAEVQKTAKKGTDVKQKAKKASGKAKTLPFRKQHSFLFPAKPKNFGIGQDIKPVKDLRRQVRWPDYVKRQRHKAILQRRLKVPPAVNQFKAVVDRTTRTRIFRMIRQYRKPTHRVYKQMLKQLALAKLKDPNQPVPPKKPTVAVGIAKVTPLVETKQATLVVIANDVTPLELVVWLPSLCRKLEVPFCIVKTSALLGRLVHLKRATCVAFTKIQSKHKARMDKILEAIKTRYTPKYEDAHRHWGGLELGKKHELKMQKRMAAAAAAAGRTV